MGWGWRGGREGEGLRGGWRQHRARRVAERGGDDGDIVVAEDGVGDGVAVAVDADTDAAAGAGAGAGVASACTVRSSGSSKPSIGRAWKNWCCHTMLTPQKAPNAHGSPAAGSSAGSTAIQDCLGGSSPKRVRTEPPPTQRLAAPEPETYSMTELFGE